jgi:hypothetical protein
MPRRCIAFTQSAKRPEILTPCPNKVTRKEARFCPQHQKAYREILIGVLNETREHRNKKVVQP